MGAHIKFGTDPQPRHSSLASHPRGLGHIHLLHIHVILFIFQSLFFSFMIDYLGFNLLFSFFSSPFPHRVSSITCEESTDSLALPNGEQERANDDFQNRIIAHPSLHALDGPPSLPCSPHIHIPPPTFLYLSFLDMIFLGGRFLFSSVSFPHCLRSLLSPIICLLNGWCVCE